MTLKLQNMFTKRKTMINLLKSKNLTLRIGVGKQKLKDNMNPKSMQLCGSMNPKYHMLQISTLAFRVNPVDKCISDCM